DASPHDLLLPLPLDYRRTELNALSLFRIVVEVLRALAVVGAVDHAGVAVVAEAVHRGHVAPSASSAQVGDPGASARPHGHVAPDPDDGGRVGLDILVRICLAADPALADDEVTPVV